MRKIKWLFSLLSLLITFNVAAQTKSLHQLQQEFVDLRLGLFVHFGPTPTCHPKFSIQSNWIATNGQMPLNPPT